MQADENEQIVVSPEAARAGRKTGVIWILSISMALAMLAGLGFLIYYWKT
jgi:hypothetical protein